MAALNIYPGAPNSGNDWTTLSSGAYAVLSGGSLNTVSVASGYVYTPSGGRWWGKSASATMDKPVVYSVTGSGTPDVVFDGRVHVPMTAQSYITYDGDDIWRIELYNNGGVGTAVAASNVYFGALGGATVSEIERGIEYRPASSKAEVGPLGLNLADMRAGKGIWFGTTEASVVSGTASVIYVWCPNGASQNPAVQWGGIAAVAGMGGAGAAGSPRYSPFVVWKTASNDPTGTIVQEGFTVIGADKHSLGHIKPADAVATQPVSDILYQSVRCYGGQDCFVVGSDAAGTILTNFRLEGEWTHDTLRNPAYYPQTVSLGVREIVGIGRYARFFEVRGGRVILGDTHGAVSLNSGATADDAQIGEDCSVSGTVFTCYAGTSYARSMATSDVTRTIISDVLFKGFVTKAQLGGTGTELHNVHWQLQQYSDVDNDETKTVVEIRNSLDLAARQAGFGVKMRRCVVDTIGDGGRGNPNRYACITVRTVEGVNVPANSVDIVDCITLGDPGTFQIQYSFQGTGQDAGTIDGTQIWRRNMSNLADEGGQTLAPGTAAPTTVAIGTLIAGASASRVDTASNIWRRGDRPTNRYGELALGAVV